MAISIPETYYKFVGIDGMPTFGGAMVKASPAKTAYELTLENDGHGTVSASTLSGFPGESATLSTTPNTDYELSGYSVTGGTIDGNTFTYGNQDATAKAWFKQSIVYLTLQNDGHGTLTATSLTGRPGDTVTLTPTYNTYYRFSAYQTTGGTINGNTYTFGTATNQTAKANFKVNAFTATGGWDKGSNVTAKAGVSTASQNATFTVSERYALHVAHTGDIPASWYSTSNRWNPSNASAYKITLAPIAKFVTKAQNTSYGSYKLTATTLIGTTQNQTQTWGGNNGTNTYSKNFTATTQSTYGISAKWSGHGGWHTSVGMLPLTGTYSANQTTGTWTATGYAP